MCASFMIRQRAATAMRLPVATRFDIDEYYEQLIVPHRPAPVIVYDNGENVLKLMRFSLVPRWLKDPKPKFATHNARLETVAEKPAWREAFRKRHCLVPFTDFIEPIYEGEHAGFMVAFHLREPGWLIAAGIWEEWTNRETGEVIESFAILTTEPPPFVAATGHDRCPLFLTPEAQKRWMENSSYFEPLELVSAQELLMLDVEHHRPMKPGWEKRK
jgi:putative SOS response-associated peptidase YedK